MGSSAFQPLLCLSKRWSPPFNSFHQPFSVFLGFGTGGVGGVSWARTKWRRSGPPSPIVPSNTLGRQLISFNSSQDMQRDTKDRNSAHSLRGGRRSSRIPLFLQLVLFQEETSLTSSLLSLSYLLLKKWQVFSFTFPSPANSKLSKSLPVSSTFFFSLLHLQSLPNCIPASPIYNFSNHLHQLFIQTSLRSQESDRSQALLFPSR